MRIKKSAKISSGNASAFAHFMQVSIKANSQMSYQLICWCSVCFFPYLTLWPSFLIDEKNRPQPLLAGQGGALGDATAIQDDL
jgi:hypothetical protein